MLDHEKLDVYKIAIEFMAIAIKLADIIPRGYSSLADQLKRAAWSIPLNIAEGCGKNSSNDKKRFYSISRGSAMECSAIIDVCRVLGVDDENSCTQGKILLTRIVAMLTKLNQMR
jgi:four helix bundle protein